VVVLTSHQKKGRRKGSPPHLVDEGSEGPYGGPKTQSQMPEVPRKKTSARDRNKWLEGGSYTTQTTGGKEGKGGQRYPAHKKKKQTRFFDSRVQTGNAKSEMQAPEGDKFSRGSKEGGPKERGYTILQRGEALGSRLRRDLVNRVPE